MAVVDKSLALFMAVQNAALEKERDANQLDDWARDSKTGGWSTHQVEPMRAKADQLRREAANLRRLLQRGE
jgi:hypothetical protein